MRLAHARVRWARRRVARTPSPRALRRAVARAAAVDARVARAPRQLERHERSRFSQNGEDGVIAEVLRRVGAQRRTCIEIGAADGRENCTRALLEDGFTGVWIEGDADAAARARAVPGATVVSAFVDRDNVAQLLRDADREPDVLVIDVDGNDWWLWRALAAAGFAPRVVVVEINGRFGPRWRWVMPYDPDHRWDGSAHYGASLAAWDQLAGELGYVLVGCESEGVNAFFVRAALADRFERPSVRDAYVPPRHMLGGHPWSRRTARPAGAPIETADALELTLDRIFGAVHAGRRFHLTAWVANRAGVTIGQPADAPVHLTWRWRGEQGEPERALGQPWCAAPGDRVLLPCRVTAPSEPGAWTLELALVQESVRWLEEPGRIELPVSVAADPYAR